MTIHKKAKKLKHQGWKDQALGMVKKVGGKMSGDKVMEAEGDLQKAIGDAERTTGKFVENVTK